MKEKVEYLLDGCLGFVKIVNPPDNSLSNEVLAGLEQIEKFVSNSELKALIIEGNGECFSTGFEMDLSGGQKSASNDLPAREKRLNAILEDIRSCEIPVVSVIRGRCFRQGFELASRSHFRFASENALFKIGQKSGERHTVAAKAGIASGSAGAILPETEIAASAALQAGIIDAISDSKSLTGAATEFLHGLVDNRPAYLVRAVMKSVRSAILAGHDTALKEENILFDSVVTKVARNAAAIQEQYL